jgi:hypothetical protein
VCGAVVAQAREEKRVLRMQASINRIRRRSIVHSRGSRHGEDSGTGSEVVGRPPSLTSSNKRRVMAALMPDVPPFAMLDRPRKGGARTSGRRRSSGDGDGAAGVGPTGTGSREARGGALQSGSGAEARAAGGLGDASSPGPGSVAGVAGTAARARAASAGDVSGMMMRVIGSDSAKGDHRGRAAADSRRPSDPRASLPL